MNGNSDHGPRLPKAAGGSHGASRQSGVGAWTVNNEIRWADAKPDLEAPAVPFPSRRTFDATGEEMLRAWVLRPRRRLAESTLQWRKRHYPFAIDEEARDILLRLLCLAFGDVGFPAEVRQEYWNWAEAFVDPHDQSPH
jgi:hemoglobin